MSIRTTPERISQRIRVDPAAPLDGCWTWLGTTTTKGYSQVRKDNRAWPVHRLIYAMVVGPVPEGMVLDHKCRNRACVNPRHLEPVTNRENILRGIVPSANRTRCKADLHILHELGIYVDSDGVERCRQCRRDSKRRYQERQRARIAA